MTIRTASGRTVRLMARIVAVGPVTGDFGGGRRAARARPAAGARVSVGADSGSTGPATEPMPSIAAGTLFTILLRRVGGDEPLQQAHAGFPVPVVAKPGERVERQTARLPQRVVAVAAGRMPARQDEVRPDDGANLGQATPPRERWRPQKLYGRRARGPAPTYRGRGLSAEQTRGAQVPPAPPPRSSRARRDRMLFHHGPLLT